MADRMRYDACHNGGYCTSSQALRPQAARRDASRIVCASDDADGGPRRPEGGGITGWPGSESSRSGVDAGRPPSASRGSERASSWRSPATSPSSSDPSLRPVLVLAASLDLPGGEPAASAPPHRGRSRPSARRSSPAWSPPPALGLDMKKPAGLSADGLDARCGLRCRQAARRPPSLFRRAAFVPAFASATGGVAASSFGVPTRQTRMRRASAIWPRLRATP